MNRHSSLFLVVWLSTASGSDAQQISVTGPPELVWSHLRQACNRTDYADVPVRPFLNERNEVIWFAGNSDAYVATKGMAGGADRLARMARAGCHGRSLSERYDSSIGRRPDTYHSGVWLEAPFSTDGRVVYAVAHNEFHGEWSGDRRYCDEQYPHNRIVLRCDYWNLIAAHSDDGGDSFALSGLGPNGLAILTWRAASSAGSLECLSRRVSAPRSAISATCLAYPPSADQCEHVHRSRLVASR